MIPLAALPSQPNKVFFGPTGVPAHVNATAKTTPFQDLLQAIASVLSAGAAANSQPELQPKVAGNGSPDAAATPETDV
ncbi:MAG TPA: hypothetical protein VHB50_24150, partial [Bryobacteraceae bacterium]|nr:hypothetical protein [Bryobacteraceae bacterium]